MSDDDQTNVVNLFLIPNDKKVFDAVNLIEDSPDLSPCAHHIRYIVDENHAWCSQCGRSFIPIDALHYLATVWRRNASTIKSAEDQMRRNVNLQVEERRLKDRIRRAKDRITKVEEPEAVRELESKNEILVAKNRHLTSSVRILSGLLKSERAKNKSKS